MQLLSSLGAIPQVHVDEGLIGHAAALAESLEVAKGRLVKPNGDLLFQPLGIGVTASLGKVIAFSHLGVRCE
jgi:hypothetical protein